jgi:Homing endonuclease associated repeat
MATSAVDALLVMYQALDESEQDELDARISDARALREAGEHSEMGRMMISLQRIAEHVGGPPSPADYKLAYRELRAAGEDIEEFNRVVRHFGSWRRAKEALALAETTTVRRIEARFRFRRVGKVWRYTEDTLRETLARCVEHYGRPPLVAEFEWWRRRELELAAAQGNDAVQLPGPTPYRNRYGGWEGALRHFGYTPEERAARFEQP